MTYEQIGNLIFAIFSFLLFLLTAHFVFFGVVGLFAYKKFPKAKRKHKYGIVISARNEETVIGNLVDSIRKTDYPQELLHVFVVAHNCTDNTAGVARQHGATVYEYDNTAEKTKGYAMKYLFECIERDYGVQNYEGYFQFDADNILNRNYFEMMNDAFEANDCQNVITSFRNSKNFGTNVMSGMYGLFFMFGCRFESRGRTLCGCSTRVPGTGFVFPSAAVKDGWKYWTLTEDWEFSADQILQGRKIVYCDDAVFYDEQPTTTRVMLRQRLRWSKGHLLVCITRSKALFKSLFFGKRRFSKYDILVNCLPVCMVAAVLAVLNFIFSMSVMFFVDDPTKYLADYAIRSAISLAIGYVGMVLIAVVLFIVERKRIANVSVVKRVGMALLFPIFMLIGYLLEIVAVFVKNVAWKTIPHTDTTKHEQLNAAVEVTT